MKETAAPGSVPEILLDVRPIGIDKIKPSLTNPRKKFNPEKQTELEASMREKGFSLSALLVRPLPPSKLRIEHDDAEALWHVFDGTVSLQTFKKEVDAQKVVAGWAEFELVAGERRFRAAKAVGIRIAPCIVRALSDNEVLEIQLVENVQRDDLTPMEEADGYARLLAMRDADGKPVYTADSLAKRIGKNPSTISRMKTLAELRGEARQAVEDGVLPWRTAILIAGIPDDKLREKATMEILHPKYKEGPLSFAAAAELMNEHFIVDLTCAPFSQEDATLVPVKLDAAGNRIQGGDCSSCPMKTANCAAYREESAAKSGRKQNRCLNPACFELKIKAEWKQWQEDNTDPAAKRRALDPAESKKAYQYGNQLCWNSPYVVLDEKPGMDVLKAGVEAPATWKKLVKGAEIEVIVVRDRNGREHELIDRSKAVEAASKLNGHKIFKTGEKEKPLNEAERTAVAEEKQLDRAIGRREAKLWVDTVCGEVQKGAKLPPNFWQQFAVAVYEGSDWVAQSMEEAMGCDGDGAEKTIRALPPTAAAALTVRGILERLMRDQGEAGGQKVAVDWGSIYGLDVKAVGKKLREQAKTEVEGIADGTVADPESVDWLTSTPPEDYNFKRRLESASAITIEAALTQLAKSKGAKTAVKALEARLAVVKKKEESAKKAQETSNIERPTSKVKKSKAKAGAK